ncbi:MAG: hypothetical protein QOG69_957 [Actinomycetota bacterium]|nr:hypothetical protein [Actinomycetota bacterium]
MLAVREGRWVLKCNECPVRMDLARGLVPKEQLRMPTGWVDLGDNAHVCTQCSNSRWQAFRAQR